MNQRNKWWFRLLQVFFGAPWKPLLIGLVLLIVARSAHHDLSFLGINLLPASLVQELIRDLGIAFFVGAIVSLGIESIARREQNEEVERQITDIQKNVLAAVLKRDFPEDYFEFLLSTIRSAKFYRIGLRVDITLKEFPQPVLDLAGESMIMYELDVSYKVRNISRVTEEFAPTLFLELPWDTKLNDVPKVTYWKVGDNEFSEAKDNDSAFLKETTRHFKIFSVPEVIALEPQKELEVEIRAFTVKYKRDSTTWWSVYPSDGLKFIIHHSEDMELYVDPKHPGYRAGPLGGHGDRTSIEIKEPLVPLTTIEITWRPRQIEPEQQVHAKSSTSRLTARKQR